jgi:hypothetical protein
MCLSERICTQPLRRTWCVHRHPLEPKVHNVSHCAHMFSLLHVLISWRTGLCRGMVSSASCCGVITKCRRRDCIDQCKSNFLCINAVCPGDCASNARCTNEDGFYTCSCPPGLVGNGRKCQQEQPEVCTTITRFSCKEERISKLNCV